MHSIPLLLFQIQTMVKHGNRDRSSDHTDTDQGQLQSFWRGLQTFFLDGNQNTFSELARGWAHRYFDLSTYLYVQTYMCVNGLHVCVYIYIYIVSVLY